MQEIAFKIKFLYCFLSTRKVLFFDTKIFQTFRSWVDCQMMLLAYVVRGHSRNATPSFWILEPINIKFLPKVCFMKCYAELALNDFIHINIDFIPQSMKKKNILLWQNIHFAALKWAINQVWNWTLSEVWKVKGKTHAVLNYLTSQNDH